MFSFDIVAQWNPDIVLLLLQFMVVYQVALNQNTVYWEFLCHRPSWVLSEGGAVWWGECIFKKYFKWLSFFIHVGLITYFFCCNRVAVTQRSFIAFYTLVCYSKLWVWQLNFKQLAWKGFYYSFSDIWIITFQSALMHVEAVVEYIENTLDLWPVTVSNVWVR
jgi:hypothetical protein